MRVVLRIVAIALFAGGMTACREPVAGVAAVLPMFGPVIGSEVIAGRAEDVDANAPVVLLVGERTLVRIDLKSGTATRRPLRIPQQDACWGLARLRDGSLWTLKSRT